MRRVALIAAVFGVASIFAAGSRTAHAAPLATTAKTKDSVDKVIVVKPDDNLSKLGVEYDSTAIRLFDANAQIIDPNLIYPGEHMHVPGPGDHLNSRSTESNLPTSASSSADGTENSTIVTYTPPVETRAPQVTTPTYSTSSASAVSTSIWTRLADCESSGNWSIDSGNGFYGGLQFTLQSWQAVGGSGYPNQASEAEQIARAEKLQTIQGWSAWPACSTELGL